MSYFLCLTKSREKAHGVCRPDRVKGGYAAARCRRKAEKGFNFVSGKLLFWCADSRFGKPRNFPVRERIVTFCVVQKVTKKHTGLRPATSIQSSAGNTFGEASDGTSRTRFFAQNGGEKALNRCEVRVLQREDLERTIKEQRYSLVDSRLWLGGNLRC